MINKLALIALTWQQEGQQAEGPVKVVENESLWMIFIASEKRDENLGKVKVNFEIGLYQTGSGDLNSYLNEREADGDHSDDWVDEGNGLSGIDPFPV